MRTLRFNIITLVLCVGLSTMYAQKLKKKHTEKFTVNKDVTIDINTRYTDIEIETWDRNEVVIDAFIELEDESTQKAIDDYLKNWKFEALGNKSSIKISSKSSGLIDIHSFNFDAPNYDILYHEMDNDVHENPYFSVPELPELPELPEMPVFPGELIVMPDLPVMPELPPLPSKFDFKAYKKDKGYLERWKKENKEVIGKNAKIKVGRNSISINSKNDSSSSYRWNITTDGQQHDAKELEERLKVLKERREAHQKEHKERLKKRRAELKIRRDEFNARMKERTKERKLALIKRQEAHEKRSKELALKRTEIRNILTKREKSKIKRIIKIKAPKGAKFNMNVRYGSMSFPKN